VTTPHDLNVIGAFSLAIADQLLDSAEEVSRTAGAQAAALITLSQESDGRSINEMARALRVSHSRAVRIADALERERLVKRVPSQLDGRAVVLRPTRKGHATAARIQQARAAQLALAVGTLKDREIVDLARLAAKVLEANVRPPERAFAICRLCDADGCGHFEGRCPVTIGARSEVAAVS